ncbi:hypothetical protein J6590_088599 [Homalodisca vitripennis]|nr:hypothetical protein J6590_088599 [Homalodisca vitripennis]
MSAVYLNSTLTTDRRQLAEIRIDRTDRHPDKNWSLKVTIHRKLRSHNILYVKVIPQREVLPSADLILAKDGPAPTNRSWYKRLSAANPSLEKIYQILQSCVGAFGTRTRANFDAELVYRHLRSICFILNSSPMSSYAPHGMLS